MSNPFYSADVVDDEAFLRHPRSGSSGFMLPQSTDPRLYSSPDPEEERLRQLLQKKREIEQRTLDSSHVSLGLLYESEKVGAATAEELNRQKQQLKATEVRLDEINSTLTTSERHLNGLKSVFGGIRNYLFAKRSGLPAPTSSASSPALATSSGAATSQMPPDHRSETPGRLQPSDFRSGSSPYAGGLVAARSPMEAKVDISQGIDDVLDRNLNEMSDGLSRLKQLAIGLNEELDEHNDIIDRLDDKMSKTDWRIKKQNQDMSKLLKK